jgi:hypothetical protein
MFDSMYFACYQHRDLLLPLLLSILSLTLPAFAQESGRGSKAPESLGCEQNLSPVDLQDVSRSAPQDAAVQVVESVRAYAKSPVKYWGNSYSNKFHKPSCPFAKAMNARHVVFFHLRCDAIAEGQVPCRYCLPPVVKRVQCKLLPKAELSSSKTESGSVASLDGSNSRVSSPARPMQPICEFNPAEPRGSSNLPP